MTNNITDITEFVQAQKNGLNRFGKEALQIPMEAIYLPLDPDFVKIIGVEAY